MHPRMDTSPETYHRWGSDRAKITPENAGELVHLRVELQMLARLPRSNGMLFGIRTYLISLEDLATNPAWARRLQRVLKTLPTPIMEYKGLSRTREPILAWLQAKGIAD